MAAAAASLSIGVCNSTASPVTTQAKGGSSTLNIGVPLALTGPIAPTAKEMVDGYKLYLKQHGNKLDNVPAKFFYADDKGSATTTTIVTKQLIAQDNIDMIGGGALAPESVAIVPVAQQNKMAFITPISSEDNLTQRKTSPYFARVNMTSSQPNLYFGDYAYKTLHYRKIAMVVQDYAYGWESGGGFQYAFQKDGGKVVKKIFVPLTASDLTPYIAQIPRTVDAVYAILVGGFVPRFEAEYKQSNLEGKVPLIGGPDMIDENALAAAGTNAVGLIGVHEYYRGLSTAKPFVNAFDKAYGVIPSYWAESTYIAATWISKAIALQESKGTSASAIPKWIRTHGSEFIKDVKAVRINAPQGPMKMDRYGNAVMNIYIFKVTSNGVKSILHTYKNASQFWTETPKQFLSHPVFSRTFPPTT